MKMLHLGVKSFNLNTCKSIFKLNISELSFIHLDSDDEKHQISICFIEREVHRSKKYHGILPLRNMILSPDKSLQLGEIQIKR